MATSTCGGHGTYYDPAAECWRYVDNGLPVFIRRACVKCGRFPSPLGHDHCIANTPGVKAACCGHGKQRSYKYLGDSKFL